MWWLGLKEKLVSDNIMNSNASKNLDKKVMVTLSTQPEDREISIRLVDSSGGRNETIAEDRQPLLSVENNVKSSNNRKRIFAPVSKHLFPINKRKQNKARNGFKIVKLESGFVTLCCGCNRAAANCKNLPRCYCIHPHPGPRKGKQDTKKRDDAVKLNKSPTEPKVYMPKIFITIMVRPTVGKDVDLEQFAPTTHKCCFNNDKNILTYEFSTEKEAVGYFQSLKKSGLMKLISVRLKEKLPLKSTKLMELRSVVTYNVIKKEMKKDGVKPSGVFAHLDKSHESKVTKVSDKPLEKSPAKEMPKVTNKPEIAGAGNGPERKKLADEAKKSDVVGNNKKVIAQPKAKETLSEVPKVTSKPKTEVNKNVQEKVADKPKSDNIIIPDVVKVTEKPEIQEGNKIPKIQEEIEIFYNFEKQRIDSIYKDLCPTCDIGFISHYFFGSIESDWVYRCNGFCLCGWIQQRNYPPVSKEFVREYFGEGLTYKLWKRVANTFIYFLRHLWAVTRNNFGKTVNPFKLLNLDAAMIAFKKLILMWRCLPGKRIEYAKWKEEKWKKFNVRKESTVNLPVLRDLTKQVVFSEFKIDEETRPEPVGDVRFKLHAHGDVVLNPELTTGHLRAREVIPRKIFGIDIPFFKKIHVTNQSHLISKRQLCEMRAPANCNYLEDMKVTQERLVRFSTKSSIVNIPHDNVVRSENDIHNNTQAYARFGFDHRRFEDRNVIRQMKLESDLQLN